MVQVAKRVNGPDGNTATEWFCKESHYDGADRPSNETTGARINVVGDSSVTTRYSARGAVKNVGSTYGDLVRSIKRDADGLVTEIAYGDGAQTTTAFDYDDLRRLRNLTTYRGTLPGGPPSATAQMLLQDEQYSYDRVGNPLEIRDWRTASEWDPGFQPVSRKMAYDDLYRLARIDYQYSQGTDVWRDPYAAEVSDNQNGKPKPAPRVKAAKGLRPQQQSWKYDWLGNTQQSDDDAHAFYDRSLGNVHNQGYRLTGAGKDADNTLATSYDAAGNLTSLTVHRTGECIPAKSDCHLQTYGYEWDEVGRLVVATRADGNVKTARLEYAYDASDERVRKSVVYEGDSRHDVYIFGSLELRLAEYSGGQYQVTPETEVPYLFAHGVRLARVVYTAPDVGTPSTRAFLELGDHLGSTSVVLDLETGELVERSTAYAYGAPESSYRPERWKSFREDYRFTGKEDDIEVGLIYFGARYLNPLLNRWISPDPLAVHAPGKADLNLYAYVHGRVLSAVDPVGLADDTSRGKEAWDVSGGVAGKDSKPQPITIEDQQRKTGYDIERGNLDLENSVRHAASDLRRSLIGEGWPEAEASKYADAYVNRTLNAQRRAIPEGEHYGEGAEQARKAFGPTWRDVASDAQMVFGAAGIVINVGKKGLGPRPQKAQTGSPTAKPAPQGTPGTPGPYQRPPNATTPQQRASVQGKPCATCGKTAPRMNADHKEPLAEEYYRNNGQIDQQKMHDVDSVQPQCPTCSNRQGGFLRWFSAAMIKLFDL